jgi:hypothetical protein
MDSESLLDDAHCFFCEPEPWRTIRVGPDINVIAGLGPLCPGYVMVAPTTHIHSVAELPLSTMSVFLSRQTGSRIAENAASAKVRPAPR